MQEEEGPFGRRYLRQVHLVLGSSLPFLVRSELGGSIGTTSPGLALGG